MKLVIVVPVLGRPQNVSPLCDSIAESTPSCHVLFIADTDDSEEIAAVDTRKESETKNQISLLLHNGSYGAKINRGISATVEPLILTAADDLKFHPGWFDAAKAKLTGRIGVVGTQDLGHRWVRAGKHATHFLVSRDYAQLGSIDGPDLFHEGYFHVCSDIELVGTAKHRNAWAFANDSVVEHIHPFFRDDVAMDDTYRKAYEPTRRTHDRKLLKSRQHLWSAS